MQLNPNTGDGHHLIAESTPGPINFDVTIYGINKPEQKGILKSLT